MRTIRLCTALAIALLAACPCVAQVAYATIDVPGASSSQATLVSGSNVVVNSSSGQYLWNGAAYIPLPTPGPFTDFVGIGGSNVVGSYTNAGLLAGFVWNSSTNTTTVLSVPGAVSTVPLGSDGVNVVGSYNLPGSSDACFVWNGANYTLFAAPGSQNSTNPGAIQGNKVVGYYGTQNESYQGISHGFLWDGTTFTTIDMPGALGTGVSGFAANGGLLLSVNTTAAVGAWADYLMVGTTFTDVDPPGLIAARAAGGGSLIWGDAATGESILWNGSTYTTIAFPGAKWTRALAVDGDTVVGMYDDPDDPDQLHTHAFIATVTPEPATLAFLAIGGLAMLRRRKMG